MSTPSSSGQYLRPRAHRLDRIFALAGWGVALFFLVTLLLSHSTMAPEIPRLQIKLPTFRTHRPEHPVTIVSGYYAIEGGKKHSLYGASSSTRSCARADPRRVPPMAPQLPRPPRAAVRVLHVAGPRRAHPGATRGQGTSTRDRGLADRNSENHNHLRVELAVRDGAGGGTGWYVPPATTRPLTLSGRPWAEAHNNIDPERGIHVPDVYGIWTAKPWIVKHAKDMNPYDSEYFFWVRRRTRSSDFR